MELRFQGNTAVREVGRAGVSSPSAKIERSRKFRESTSHISFTHPDHRGYVLFNVSREGIEASFYGVSTALKPNGERILLKRVHIPRS
ncbi:MAG: hypothetical protein AB7T14_00255 [Candidatus Methylacidiphilaceae bacterium]